MSNKRILLINPPVYDLRIDWARWHQPCGLLRIGGLLQRQKKDVRLIDCLQPSQGDRLERKKIGTVSVEGIDIPRWHLGWDWYQVAATIEGFKKEKWKPDAVYVTCMMTFWWEAARDLIRQIQKQWLPKTPVFLGGVYSLACPDHAARNFKGVHFGSLVGKRAEKIATDFRLYEKPPQFAGLFLYRSRSADRIVGEIQKKADRGVRAFAFFDDQISRNGTAHFEAVLDAIRKRKFDLRLLALGNLSPSLLTKALAVKMSEAGYRQIFLRDDAPFSESAANDLSAYERAMELLHRYGGYRPRTEDVTAMVVVGFPSENLEIVTERLTRLANIVGSVNLVPYQPTPGTPVYERHRAYLQKIPLEKQSCKLFPFAKLNNATFADYEDLVRLGALLNSKYRSTTFDFLGENRIAEMVRASIANESWRPKLKEPLVAANNAK